MFRSRVTSSCVLLIVSVWFTLVVPAHSRGLVSVPQAGAAESCGDCCPRPGDPEREGSRPADPVRCCAVCQLAMKVTQGFVAPVLVAVSVPRHETVHESSDEAPPVRSLSIARTRGPPVSV